MTRSEKRTGRKAPDGATGPDAASLTLETFVAQLHSEGVETGRHEARRLAAEAREEAAEIIRRAKAEADALLAEARDTASRERERAEAELTLAARDAVIELRTKLNEVLETLLSRAADARLRDPEFLGSLLREMAGAYARADAEGRPTEVRVPRELAEQLEAWWLKEVAAGLTGASGLRVEGALREAGFEYRVRGGTVEVSVESTVEKLMEMVRPRLREILDRGPLDADGEVGVPALARSTKRNG